MKKSLSVIFLCLAISIVTTGQKIVKGGKFNPEKIKSELTEKYKSYNGRLEDQTVELWDTYFLNSPNIGNIHKDKPEIGWETFHKGTIEFVNSKLKGELRLDNLEIYPISSNTAWVKGRMVITIKDQSYKDIFYDSLVKTVDGWRVVVSVVNPEL